MITSSLISSLRGGDDDRDFFSSRLRRSFAPQEGKIAQRQPIPASTIRRRQEKEAKRLLRNQKAKERRIRKKAEQAPPVEEGWHRDDQKLSDGTIRTVFVNNIPQNSRHCITPGDDEKEVINDFIDYMRQSLDALPELKDIIGAGKWNIEMRSEEGQFFSTPLMSLSIDDTIQQMVSRHLIRFVRTYKENPFCIDMISIRIVEPDEMIMGSSSRSIAQAHKSWLVLSPTSRTNCLYQALSVCKNFKNNPNLLTISEHGQYAREQAGRELKRQIKPTKDNFADEKCIQEACDYLRYPIALYNNTFEKIKTFMPANPLGRYRGEIKEYEIQATANHCVALVRKKHILSAFPDFVFPELEAKVSEHIDSLEMITTKKTVMLYNKKIASWDIETSPDANGVHTPYACSVAYRQEQDLVEQQFWGLDCLVAMTNWIHENKLIFSGYTFYAHNGGRYDLPLAIRNAFLDSDKFAIEGKGCLELNNAWIGFTLRAKDDRKFKIYFRDSFRLLPMSLEKLCNELEVKHRKLPETISHSDITLDNYHTFPALKKYLTHDVFGLYEVIEKFGSAIYQSMKIDITKCFTGASLSKKNFFRNYYNQRKNPVYKLTKAMDNLIRNSYFGGRVECFQMGKVGKCYYYDFTSLYPDVGREYLPCGKPIEIELNNMTHLPDDFFGFVECHAKTKNFKAIPKHSIISDQRLVFPIMKNWTTITVFSEELDYDIYEYQFIKGIKFDKSRFMAKFFNDGFINKAKAKKENNPALAQAYKIIINSGYGFWGLRTEDRDGVQIFENGDSSYLKYLNTDKLINIREYGGYYFCRVLKDLDVRDFNVAVASAISSYARSKLHSLLTDIRAVGGNVYYCDTDSVICNINLNDHPQLRQKFQWDGIGAELGCLKNECDEYIEKIVSKHYGATKGSPEFNKRYSEVLEAENGNLSWDSCIITGCKQYALKKVITLDGTPYPIEINKLKGYSQSKNKLHFSDMEQLSEGKNITQQQIQFRCPKSNYVSDTHIFEIRTEPIEKRFRRTYTKGVLFQNYVLPHII